MCSWWLYHHWKRLAAKGALGRQLNSYRILKIIDSWVPYWLTGGLAQVLVVVFFPSCSLDKSQHFTVSRLIVSFHWRKNTTLGPNFTPWPWLWFIPVVYGIYLVSIILQKSKMPVSVPASWYIHSCSFTFYCVFLFFFFLFKKNLKFEWATSFLLKKKFIIF